MRVSMAMGAKKGGVCHWEQTPPRLQKDYKASW